MKILFLLEVGTIKDHEIIPERRRTYRNVFHVVEGLRSLGHDVTWCEVPDRRFYDVAVAVNPSPYLHLVRAKKYFTDLYEANQVVLEQDGVFFRSYHHQYLVRKHSRVELEKCAIVGNVIEERDADRGASDTYATYGELVWPVPLTWGLYHLVRLWERMCKEHPLAFLYLMEPANTLDSVKLDANIRGVQAVYTRDAIRRLPRIAYTESTSNHLFPYTYDPQLPTDMFGTEVGQLLENGGRAIVPADTAMSEVWGKRGALVLPNTPLDVPNSFEDNLWIDAIESVLEGPAPLVRGIEDYYWYNVVGRYVQAFEGSEVEFGRPGMNIIGNASSATTEA